jgi:hypothetical protein
MYVDINRFFPFLRKPVYVDVYNMFNCSGALHFSQEPAYEYISANIFVYLCISTNIFVH